MATNTTFSEEQKGDWQRAQEALSQHPCKCGVCAANLYLKIRAERARLMPTFIGARQRHQWDEKPEKPWTCKICGCYTANLRHIQNGFCRHEWGERAGMTCCVRCGIVMNNRNAEATCIGVVKVELRRAPTEEGGVVYTDDEPITE